MCHARLVHTTNPLSTLMNIDNIAKTTVSTCTINLRVVTATPGAFMMVSMNGLNRGRIGQFIESLEESIDVGDSHLT
jgi:hypothetical protein